jgi:anti-sigma factor RsiW
MGISRNGKTDEPIELAALADDSLDPRRRTAVEAEIAESPELAELLEEQERALSFVRSAVSATEAPAGLRRRIEARRAPRRRSQFLLAGAAAAVVAVGLIAFFAVGSRTTSKSFRAALGPTARAPAATGKATLTKTASGWRIELDTNGLPRLDDGAFYEAWLANSAGVLVPVGTFNEGRHVTLWAGVSPAKGFTRLTVTREQADGNQASSGEKVLAGSVQPPS